MPAIESFLDTNILLYSINTAPAEAEKTRIARALIQTKDWAWSAQVAAEFVRVAPGPQAQCVHRREDDARKASKILLKSKKCLPPHDKTASTSCICRAPFKNPPFSRFKPKAPIFSD